MIRVREAKGVASQQLRWRTDTPTADRHWFACHVHPQCLLMPAAQAFERLSAVLDGRERDHAHPAFRTRGPLQMSCHAR
jgi:hypothetical protein